jgi:integrase
VLRSALSAAMRDELVERNVAELVTTPKQRKRKVVPWTSEEARRFLESARSDADGLYAAYVLVLVLGMRKGEVLGLRWGAVDFDHRKLIVDHQLQRVRRQLLYRETKTEASDDSLPLPDIACTALRLRISQQESARERAREAWRVFEDPQGEPVDLVFTGRYGTPHRSANLQPRVHGPMRPGRSSPPHRSRRSPDLRHPARRPGRAPTSDHAHS